MPRFLAEVEFTFEAESLDAVGAELRRLSQAAEAAGFEMRRGQAAPAPPDEDDSGPTGYGPLIDDPRNPGRKTRALSTVLRA